ncbi:death-associated protein kinase dapk-1-like [Sycon ciliatum]|uniref:death-associated protein kinase dapk-1-like n=1 Tax=Sycon ciliatum TaxID=27933 RepID=UPI0031F607EC
MESFQDELVDLCVRDKAEEIKAKLLVNGQVTAHAANGYHRKSGVSFLAYLGWTACQQDSRRVLQFLLKTVSGDVFSQPCDKEGRTAIHAATLQKHLECLKLLCAANLNLNSSDYLGRTPLHLACEKGFPECAEILCNAKAEVNLTDDLDCTPLHLACEKGFPECAEILCNAKARVNLTDSVGRTPLHLACEEGFPECAEILVNAKAQVNLMDALGRTPLHLACEEGFTECAQILCNAKARINLPYNVYDTPLDLALQGWHTEVVSIILKYIRTVLSNQEVVAFLCGRARKISWISYSSHWIPVMETILDCISNVSVKLLDMEGWVGAFSAASHDCIRQLIKMAAQQHKLRATLVQILVKRRMENCKRKTHLVVRLLGPPGSGKTSLLKSLHKRHTFYDRLVYFVWRDQGDRIESARTRGIERFYHEGIVFLDLGGQYRYMSNHQRLTKFSTVPAVNIITVSSVETKVCVRHSARQWCNFIACSCEDGEEKGNGEGGSDKTANKVLMVASRRDKAGESQRDVVSAECELLKDTMGDHLQFMDQPVIFVNAVDENCDGVAKVRDIIEEMKREVKEPDTPMSAVEYFLEDIRLKFKDTPAVSLEEFTTALANLILGERFEAEDWKLVNRMVAIAVDLEQDLHDLHQKAEVFFFAQVQLVVLEPTWLMSDITSKLYTPTFQRSSFITCNEFGFAKRSNVEQVLGNCTNSPVKLPGDKVLEIAQQLGMCHLTDHGNEVMILPAQAESRTAAHWPVADEKIHRHYTGRRLHCRSGIAMSAALMPAIQHSILTELCESGDRCPVWQGGIRVVMNRYPQVDTLVEIPAGQLALNVVTRGYDQQDVARFQEMVWHHILKLPQQLSPGSRVDMVFEDDEQLSSSGHLRKLDQQGELNAAMAFLASDHIRATHLFPPAAKDVGADQRRKDPRLTHEYAGSADCQNASTIEERRRASRLCSALYQHRILLNQDFPLVECLRRLNQRGQLEEAFKDDVDEKVREHRTSDAADMFRQGICDLPDSVVLSLVDDVLPELPAANTVYRAVKDCPGYSQCKIPPHHTHAADVGVSSGMQCSASSDAFLDNPFNHPSFMPDIHVWLQSIPADDIREAAQTQGLLTDHNIDKLIRTDRYQSNREHNCELLHIIMNKERQGYIALCRMIQAIGQYAVRLEQMNSLLAECDRV